MWLSRLIVACGLLLLSGCSGLEIKSIGQALYERNAFIEVAQSGGRNGQLYSRHLRSRLAYVEAAATHSVPPRSPYPRPLHFLCRDQTLI